MLVVHEQARSRFEAAKAHARRIGLRTQFARQLNYLRTYAEHDITSTPRTRVTLHTDFAPHSFSIIWERRDSDGKWKYWFNGGLIFHGPHDNGSGGAPTFCVNLQPHHGWSVHT